MHADVANTVKLHIICNAAIKLFAIAEQYTHIFLAFEV